MRRTSTKGPVRAEFLTGTGALAAFLLTSTPGTAHAHGQDALVEVVSFLLAAMLAFVQWLPIRACRPNIPPRRRVMLRRISALLGLVNAGFVLMLLHNVYFVEFGADLSMVIVPVIMHAAAALFATWWLLRTHRG